MNVYMTQICSAGLKRYFAEKIATMTKINGLRLQTCEDLLFDSKDRPFNLKRFNSNILVVARRNIWELGKAHQAYRLANNGYKVQHALFYIST